MEESLTDIFRATAYNACFKAVNVDKTFNTSNQESVRNCLVRFIDSYRIAGQALLSLGDEEDKNKSA